jgi:O-methyltransferase
VRRVEGGTSMLGAMTLLGRQDTWRRVWLYDTFAGMTGPTDDDVSQWDGIYARQIWSANRDGDHNKWCFSPLEEVKRNFLSTGYPGGQVNFIKGDVAQTLLQHVPDKIAVLRLDTDWYESTKAEMDILYPRLSKGGVILIDDYSAWAGAKKAVDEYITANKVPLMLHPDRLHRM